MAGDVPLIPGFPPNYKETDIRFPPPSKAFVFIDERDDSIDDGLFWAIADSPRSWPNIAASWHSRGDVLSFGDAHAEHWRWREPTTLTATFPYGKVTSPVDRDWERVRSAYATKD
jgi:hypothetical protein